MPHGLYNLACFPWFDASYYHRFGDRFGGRFGEYSVRYVFSIAPSGSLHAFWFSPSVYWFSLVLSERLLLLPPPRAERTPPRQEDLSCSPWEVEVNRLGGLENRLGARSGRRIVYSFRSVVVVRCGLWQHLATNVDF